MRADGTGIVAAGGNKTVWLPALIGDAGGILSESNNFSFVQMTDGVTHTAYVNWGIPDDFTSLTSLTVVVTAGGTGDALVTFSASARNDGDNRAGGGTDDSIAETTYALTSNLYDYIDVTAAVNGLTLNALEMMSLKLSRNGGGGADTIGNVLRLVGAFVVYS
tara:strand:- start:39 stop:527 length:489 start_codon:yes stop_codon:yes gene_type:complete